MVKYTQTTRRLFPTNCLSVFDHFVGLALKGLNFLTQVILTLTTSEAKNTAVSFL